MWRSAPGRWWTRSTTRASSWSTARRLATATMVWTAGVRPADVLDATPRRIEVDDHFRIVGADRCVRDRRRRGRAGPPAASAPDGLAARDAGRAVRRPRDRARPVAVVRSGTGTRATSPPSAGPSAVGQVGAAVVHRLRRMDRLARRPPVLPDRVREPAAGAAPLGLVLRAARPADPHGHPGPPARHSRRTPSSAPTKCSQRECSHVVDRLDFRSRSLSRVDEVGAIVPGAVIVGTQWGDEGKGRFTDYLAKEASLCVRYQGGHNAGHTHRRRRRGLQAPARPERDPLSLGRARSSATASSWTPRSCSPSWRCSSPGASTADGCACRATPT